MTTPNDWPFRAGDLCTTEDGELYVVVHDYYGSGVRPDERRVQRFHHQRPGVEGLEKSIGILSAPTLAQLQQARVCEDERHRLEDERHRRQTQLLVVAIVQAGGDLRDVINSDIPAPSGGEPPCDTATGTS